MPRGVYERTEHRRKLSEACKGRPNPFAGKKHSPEARAKMSKGVRKALEEGRLVTNSCY